MRLQSLAGHRLVDARLAVSALNSWLAETASRVAESMVMVSVPAGPMPCDEVYEYSRTATGFAIDRDVVVSVAHIGSDSRVCLIDANGDRFEGVVLDVDRRWDIAFIRSSRPLNPISVSLEKPPIGSLAIACGMPYGILRPFFSLGLVSGYNVNTVIDGRYVEGLMVLSLPSMPGMSGGPVVNVEGNVVGVLVANAMNSGEFTLAVPAKRIHYSYGILRKLGRVAHAKLGLKIAEGVAKRIGSAGRVVVTNVLNTRISEACGIRVGSVLISLDDVVVQSVEDVWDALDKALALGKDSVAIRFRNVDDGRDRECVYRLEAV